MLEFPGRVTLGETQTRSYEQGEGGKYLCFSLLFLMAAYRIMFVSLIHSRCLESRSGGIVSQQNGSILSGQNRDN